VRITTYRQDTKGAILTGQTRLRFGLVRFNLVHFGRMRGQNHYVSLRFNIYGVCWYKKIWE